MGYLERNSETLKTPGFSGFECRVSGIGRVSIFGFGSGSGSKKVGLFPRVSGFRVQRPITSLCCLKSTPFLIRRQIMRLLGLADFFKFRACLAGRYLCSQNVNKYSKQPAKPSKHVIQFRIRNDIDFSQNSHYIL